MAAGMLPPLVAQVLAQYGQFTAAMGAVKGEVMSLQAATTKAAAMGKVAAQGLALAAAGVGYESVKMAMGFDQQMEVVHTQAGASQAEVERMKDSLLALAPAVGIGPEKLAQGLYHIESTGMRGAKALDVLTQAAKLSAIGMADLDDVTYAMSGVMSVGMKDIKDASDAISYMNATVGMGDMRMSQLAAAIGTGILPSFKSAGLGMMDFSAAIATIADNSTPADEAATRLRMTISMMAAPSGPARDALKEIGLSATSLAYDLTKPQGLLVAVTDLKKHLEDSGKTAVEQNAIMERAFGGGKTSGSILTLLEEVDRLKSKYQQLGTAESRAKITDEAWAQQQKQFTQQWHEFTAQLQVVGVKIGNWLIPKLQAAVVWMKDNMGTVKLILIGLASVISMVTVAWIANAIAEAAALWPLYLIIAAVALVGVGIYELVTHWGTVWGFIKRISLDVWHALVDAWHWVLHELGDGVSWVRSHVIDPVVHLFMVDFYRPFLNVIHATLQEWRFFWGFASVIINDAKRVWQVAWAAIGLAALVAWQTFLKPAFDSIYSYGIRPLMWAVGKFREGWDANWKAVTDAAHWAWEHVLRPVFGFVITRGLDSVRGSVEGLKIAWAIVWDDIKSVVSTAWDFMKGIFDKINAGMHDILTTARAIGNAPGDAGAQIAHLLGFAEGGTVPGPVGVPRLAVVHGGEEILSNDQVQAMGRRPTAVAGGGSAPGGGGDIVVHARFVMPDGRHYRTETLRYARRAGLDPATQLFPASATRTLTA